MHIELIIVGKARLKKRGEHVVIKVAVSADLSYIKDYLADEGIQVVDLDEHLLYREGGGISAVVVSGGDSNLLGMADIQTVVPVIEAGGLTTEEILAKVREKGRLGR